MAERSPTSLILAVLLAASLAVTGWLVIDRTDKIDTINTLETDLKFERNLRIETGGLLTGARDETERLRAIYNSAVDCWDISLQIRGILFDTLEAVALDTQVEDGDQLAGLIEDEQSCIADLPQVGN